MLAERLRQLRLEKKIKQSDIADSVNISRISVSNYENGERVPDADVLYKLAKYFDVSSDYILGLSDFRKPENLHPLINSLLSHHEYSKKVGQILSNLESFIHTSDVECERISNINEKELIQERLESIRDLEYVLSLEKHIVKEKLQKVKRKIIEGIDYIEDNTLEYVVDKLNEYQHDYSEEVKATIEED